MIRNCVKFAWGAGVVVTVYAIALVLPGEFDWVPGLFGGLSIALIFDHIDGMK